MNKAAAFAAQALGSARTGDVRLEEVETSKANGRPVWLITLSSTIPDQAPNTMAELSRALGGNVPREYKIFAVDKGNGDVLSMKIRLLQANNS